MTNNIKSENISSLLSFFTENRAWDYKMVDPVTNEINSLINQSNINGIQDKLDEIKESISQDLSRNASITLTDGRNKGLLNKVITISSPDDLERNLKEKKLSSYDTIKIMSLANQRIGRVASTMVAKTVPGLYDDWYFETNFPEKLKIQIIVKSDSKLILKIDDVITKIFKFIPDRMGDKSIKCSFAFKNRVTYNLRNDSIRLSGDLLISGIIISKIRKDLFNFFTTEKKWNYEEVDPVTEKIQYLINKERTINENETLSDLRELFNREITKKNEETCSILLIDKRKRDQQNLGRVVTIDSPEMLEGELQDSFSPDEILKVMSLASSRIGQISTKMSKKTVFGAYRFWFPKTKFPDHFTIEITIADNGYLSLKMRNIVTEIFKSVTEMLERTQSPRLAFRNEVSYNLKEDSVNLSGTLLSLEITNS